MKLWQGVSRVGGLVLSVLGIGHKVRGIKPGLGGAFLRGIEIRTKSSFGEEVTPSAPCRKVFRHVQNHFEV
jgi:hypothetical protein